MTWLTSTNAAAQSPLDPKKEDDARWQDKCRKLPARFLEDLLTRSPWQEEVPFEGVQINSARVVGDINLENAKLIRPIKIFGSQSEGAINLRRARTDSLIGLAASLVNGAFVADSLHSESDLFLRNGAVFKSNVSLNGAKIDGIVEITGASFDGTLDADKLHVGSSLLMRFEGQNKARFKDVTLRGANITGQIDMTGASFDGTLEADVTEFFNDPKRERLTGWQSFIFSVIGIVGFVLAAILGAAVSGLTQSSEAGESPRSSASPISAAGLPSVSLCCE